MRNYAAMLGAAALLISTGIAAAQSQTPKNYDSSGAPKTGSEQPRSGGGLTSGAGGGAGMTGAPVQLRRALATLRFQAAEHASNKLALPVAEPKTPLALPAGFSVTPRANERGG